MLIDQIKTVAIGAGGIATTSFTSDTINAVVSSAEVATTGNDIVTIFDIILKLVLGIATLIGIFKRKKKKEQPQIETGF